MRISILILFLGISLSGCKLKDNQQESISTRQPASPRFEARYDHSNPPAEIDIEKAIQRPAPLKLSQIASKLEYYNVGDARFTPTQAIAIPDSDAFITFNNPRIYYRKRGIPSKRYAFKALEYKWNNRMNGLNLFYDKKTTRMYCALSGLDKTNKEDSLAILPPPPFIGELPPLDSLLTMQSYIYPESVPVKYSFGSPNDKLIGFSSSGYTLCSFENDTIVPNGVITFNLQGDTLCKFAFKPSEPKLACTSSDSIQIFQTFYWNTDQDKMSFMIPFCDTVYQLANPQTLTPLYAIRKEADAEKPIGLRSFLENPQGLFMGIFQKSSPIIGNWLGWWDEFKPILTHRVAYLKKDGRTYSLPHDSGGLINDLDGGLPFWPDGQTDDCLYMLRTVTEMRETVKRTGSSRQAELIKFLDDPKVHERDYVMIVARP